MADCVTKFRTNYFTVTDIDRLKHLCEMQPDMEVIQDDKGRVVLIGNDSWCEVIELDICVSCEKYDRKKWVCSKDSVNPNELSCKKSSEFQWVDALQKILPDNEIVVFQEIGYEKHRYLTAHSAIISKNSIKFINLNELTTNAAKEMQNDAARNIDLFTSLDGQNQVSTEPQLTISKEPTDSVLEQVATNPVQTSKQYVPYTIATVDINVGGEPREAILKINQDGNLVLSGIGSVLYEMLEEELILMKVQNK